MKEEFDDIFDEGRFDDAFREGLGDFEAEPPQGAFDGIMKALEAEKPKTRFFERFKYAAAASLLLLSATAASYYLSTGSKVVVTKPEMVGNTLPIEGNKAAKTENTAPMLTDSPDKRGKLIEENPFTGQTLLPGKSRKSTKLNTVNNIETTETVLAANLVTDQKQPNVFDLAIMQNKGFVSFTTSAPLNLDLNLRDEPIDKPGFSKNYLFASVAPIRSYQNVDVKSEHGGILITETINNPKSDGGYSINVGAGRILSLKTAVEISGHMSSFVESVHLTGRSIAPDELLVSADASKMTITPLFFNRDLINQKQNTLVGLSFSLRRTLGHRGRVSHFAKISLGANALVYVKGNTVQSVYGNYPSKASNLSTDKIKEGLGYSNLNSKVSAVSALSYQVKTRLTPITSFYVEPFIQSQLGSMYKSNSVYQLRFNNIGVNFGLNIDI